MCVVTTFALAAVVKGSPEIWAIRVQNIVLELVNFTVKFQACFVLIWRLSNSSKDCRKITLNEKQ